METGGSLLTAPMEMKKVLNNISYPATKSEIIGHVRKSGAMNVMLLQKLGMLEDKKYNSSDEVLRELERR